MAKFSNAKVGDRVYDVVLGWGVIKEIESKEDYPIRVKYRDRVFLVNYTLEGKDNLNNLYPSLFWNEVKLPTEEEDKKPFNLVEFLRENLELKEFGESKSFVILYCCIGEKFMRNDYETTNFVGLPYFEKNNIDVVLKTLNDKKITPQQLKEAYKELGWL